MSKIYCTPLRGPFGEKLDKFFRRENGFVEVNPGNVIMPRKYSEICEEIIDSHVRKDDVWMVSYPRTGEYNFLPFFLRRHIEQQSQMHSILKVFRLQ